MTLIEQLQRSIALSQDLIEIVKNEDWANFAELETERQQLVRSLDVESIELADAEAFRQGFKELIALNETLEKLCIDKRAEAVAAIKQLKLGAKASKAYGA